jgi:bacterioferritin-associated ferredoxin
VKAILCPCEDITVREVEDVVRHGYATLEDVKRYTGLATGTCQGKLCLAPCVDLLVRLTQKTPEEIGLITFRPPVEPVPLGLMAAGEKLHTSREGLHD